MPFTAEQFLNVFKNYNTAVFPAQIIFIILACSTITLLFYDKSSFHRIICAVLSFFWLWIGVVYHIIFFTSINKAAYGFGILFIIQALLFLFYGVIKEEIQFNLRRDWIGAVGWTLIIYSLLIYPALGFIQGHGYPYQPTFGLPCPTTIFTFGLLVFTSPKTRMFIYVIPFLWSLLGFSAVVNLGILEDTGLLIAALTSTSLMIYQKRTAKKLAL